MRVPAAWLATILREVSVQRKQVYAVCASATAMPRQLRGAAFDGWTRCGESPFCARKYGSEAQKRRGRRPERRRAAQRASQACCLCAPVADDLARGLRKHNCGGI